METYRIEITPDAEADVENCYRYILETYHSWDTADAFLDDYGETLEKLRLGAGRLKIGDHPLMQARGIRRWNFLKHDYFMLYTVREDLAIILAVAHFRKDIGNILK